MSKQNIEFKDSGIPWIGKIPKHWVVTKIKYECFLKGRIGWQGLTTAEYIEEGAYLVTGVDFLNGNIDWQNCVRVSEWRFNQAPEIQIKNNDLLITKDGTVGKIALTKDTPKQATLNSGVMLIRPKNKNYYEKFLFYILSSDQFWLWFSYINSGNTTIIHLYQNSFDNFSFTLPPLNEQEKIAEFLDKKCEIIDKRLSNLERKIKSLKEYKKSLISECVTKGLNPKNMEFKDSGILWIGQIPKHWEISKIKYHGTARNGLTYSPSDLTDENGILVLRASNIQNDKLSFNDNVYVSCPIKNEIFIKKGDILICATNGSKELVGKNVLIKENIKCAYGGFMMVLRSEISNFLQYILKSKVFEYHRPSFSTTTINQLTREKLLNLEFPLPPLNEQKEIAEFLDKKCEKIDRLNENYAKQITTLKEYKKSLIYECVTGKKEI